MAAIQKINMKDLIGAVEGMSVDEKKLFISKLMEGVPAVASEKKTRGRPKANKASPVAPVLKEGWMFKPYEKGAKKGQDRWYNEDEDTYTEEKSVAYDIPAVASEKKTAGRKKKSPEDKEASKKNKEDKLAKMSTEERAAYDAMNKEKVAKMQAAKAAKKVAKDADTTAEDSE